MKKIDLSSLELTETVVHINRVAKVVKGGRRFKFGVVVVVGDASSHVGAGFGKAGEIAEAIRKATEDARKNLVRVNLVSGTIPHPVVGKCGASRVMLRPASEGTGVIACDSVRAVLESAGVRNALTKSLGSNTGANLVKATLDGLLHLRNPEEVAKQRGKSLEEIAPHLTEVGE